MKSTKQEIEIYKHEAKCLNMLPEVMRNNFIIEYLEETLEYDKTGSRDTTKEKEKLVYLTGKTFGQLLADYNLT